MPAADSLEMANFRANLPRLIAEKNTSIAALAREAGVSRRMIYDVLEGQKDCGVAWAGRIARTLGVTFDDLFKPR